MKYFIFFLFLMPWMFSTEAIVSWAGEEKLHSPAAQKVKEIVESAHAFVTENSVDMSVVQKALHSDKRFWDHDQNLYIFLHCYNIEKKEIVVCGHGKRPDLLGRNMWHLRTPSGRLIIQEVIQLVESQGEGWIKYDWLNPYSDRLQTKNSYVKGLVLKDGRKASIGCGFWFDKNKENTSSED